MDIHPTSRISLKAHLDETHPMGILVGRCTTVTFGVAILAPDMARRMRRDKVIGKNCFIGAHSNILPGVIVGDGSIVAAGSIVNGDVPLRCIVAANPAKVVREMIETMPYGVFAEHVESGRLTRPTISAPLAGEHCLGNSDK